MCESGAHPGELPARLYALLLAYPELDPGRTPSDWLVRGVNAEGLRERCCQLYQREVADHPAEALRERFSRLLEGDMPHVSRIELLGWCWEALAQLGRTDLIPADLSRVGPTLKHADEEMWVRTMLKAADYLAFGDKYWIYPTYSAPYDAQTFFNAFSFPDLVNWSG
jgi:hypothetical protein